MNIASPEDSAVMSQASKTNEILQNVFIWSVFYGPPNVSGFVPCCQAFLTFLPQACFKKRKGNLGLKYDHLIPTAGPTNITWYHKTKLMIML